MNSCVLPCQTTLLVSLMLLGTSIGPAAPVFAQPAPKVPPVEQPGGISPPTPAPDALTEALALQPGGLTLDEVARLAASSRHSVRQKQAELRAAAARVDQALVWYFPRLSVSATYTRLSEITPGSFGPGGVVTTTSGGSLPTQIFVGACAPGQNAPPGTSCLVDGNGSSVKAIADQITFPIFLNSYSFLASLSVPISDYLFRIRQNYSSAVHSRQSKRIEAAAEALQAAADARIAYLNWLRVRGQHVIARQAIDQAGIHLVDAQKGFQLGTVAKADLLRLEAQHASAQQAEVEIRSLALVTTEQLRVALGYDGDQPMGVGIDVMNSTSMPPAETLHALQEQAFSRRLELRAMDEAVQAMYMNVAGARAGYLPRIDAFADLIYANPNLRVIPQRDQFDGSWDAGVRLSWTVNESLTAIGATAEAKARLTGLNEQKGALRDALRLEVAVAYGDVLKGPQAIEAAKRWLVAAEETLRTRKQMFINGKATGADLIDAETEVTRGRFRWLDALIGQFVAQTRLDHATGRDIPAEFADK